MKHSPYHAALDDALFDDDDDDDDAIDNIPSADEDEEDELLIANPVLFKRALWTRRTAVEATVCFAAWCLSGSIIAFVPQSQTPLLTTSACMAVTFVSSRVAMHLLELPTLLFDCSWHLYLQWIGLAGVLTAIEVSAWLWSTLSCSPAEITLGCAIAPLLQLACSAAAGLHRSIGARLPLAVVALATGFAIMSFGEDGRGPAAHPAEGHAARAATTLRPPILPSVAWMLAGAAALAGWRGMLVQRLLHGGHSLQDLLPHRQVVHPLPLMCAIAPWAAVTSAALGLACGEVVVLAHSSAGSSHDGWVQLHPQGAARSAAAAPKPLALGVVAPACVVVAVALWLELHAIARTSALSLSVVGAAQRACTAHLAIASRAQYTVGTTGAVGATISLLATLWYGRESLALHPQYHHQQQHTYQYRD